VYRRVELELSGPGAIHFTVDGSEPTEKSRRYTDPIIINSSAIVRARAFHAGVAASPVVSRSYTIADKKVLEFSSNLPLIVINTFGRSIQKEEKTSVTVRVIDGDNAKRATLSGKADYDGDASLNYHGNTSLRYPKRSLHLKTRAGDGEALKIPLLGMPKESDWILYAPYPDKTLIRDVLAYELSNKMGEYAPRTRLVELFVNTDGKVTLEDYVGVYVLVEKIKRDKERVNIAKLTPQDVKEPELSGGYIFKKDHTDRTRGVPMITDLGMPDRQGGGNSLRPGFPTEAGGFPAKASGFIGPQRKGIRRSLNAPAAPNAGNGQVPTMPDVFFGGMGDDYVSKSLGFGTDKGNQFFFVEPKSDQINPQQRSWLKRYVNQAERAIYGPDFRDPAKGYAAFIDVDSFIDHHLLVEATKNVDGFRFSTFYYKDRGGKIHMGPAWDWNLSMGNVNGKQGWMPKYWYWPQLDDHQYSWFRRLFQDPDFGQRYVDRWATLRTNAFATSNVLARIDQLAGQLKEAQQRNFQRWPIMGRMIWPNHSVWETYQQEIDWLKSYLTERFGWIDEQFIASPEPALNSRELTLRSREQGAKIYYTLDGSDPRGAGGAPAAAARVYEKPIAITGTPKLFARAFAENLWSAPVRAEYRLK